MHTVHQSIFLTNPPLPFLQALLQPQCLCRKRTLSWATLSWEWRLMATPSSSQTSQRSLWSNTAWTLSLSTRRSLRTNLSLRLVVSMDVCVLYSLFCVIYIIDPKAIAIFQSFFSWLKVLHQMWRSIRWKETINPDELKIWLGDRFLLVQSIWSALTF